MCGRVNNERFHYSDIVSKGFKLLGSPKADMPLGDESQKQVIGYSKLKQKLGIVLRSMNG